MADGSISFADGLGTKTVDSHELYRRNRSIASSQQGHQPQIDLQQGKSRVTLSTTNFTPSKPLDLQNPDVFPKLPQSVNPKSTPTTIEFGDVSPNADEIENRTGTLSPKNSQSSFPKSNIGTHSPKSPQASPSQTLQQAFQEESQRKDMAASGVSRQLNPSFPANQAPKVGYQSKSKNWASLLQAQGPSQAMKLDHYPALQQGKNAILELDENLVDSGKWTNCLVGYFLDGKMNFNLLRSTAHKVWDSLGLVSVIPDVSGFTFFEFRDEEAKLSVLEKGPWFFSKRYLVLKNWHRMLSPTKVHPSKISAWIRIHGLPLELWNQECFSRIASVIGRPIHVDRATVEKSRIMHARICVEIDAHNDLPHEIAITIGRETVVVGIEYQVCPPICSSCKVFGHSNTQCSISSSTKPVNSSDSCKTIGQSVAPCSKIQCNSNSEPRAGPPSSNDVIPQATETSHLPSALGSSYVQAVNNATSKGIDTPQSVPLATRDDSTTIRNSANAANIVLKPNYKKSDSMKNTLLSNSFHVLQEVHPELTIPPDKEHPKDDPLSEGICDTNYEEMIECESPSTPVTSHMDFLLDDLPTFGGSKKQQKKAAKIAWQRSSQQKREF